MRTNRPCRTVECPLVPELPVELIAGSLPKRQLRLVEAWAELHQAELSADWEELQQGKAPKAIEPLK